MRERIEGQGPLIQEAPSDRAKPTSRQEEWGSWAPAYHLPTHWWALRVAPTLRDCLEHKRFCNQAPILQPRKLRPRKVLSALGPRDLVQDPGLMSILQA